MGAAGFWIALNLGFNIDLSGVIDDFGLWIFFTAKKIKHGDFWLLNGWVKWACAIISYALKHQGEHLVALL